MGDTSHDTIQFLREEFAKPLDIRGFIRSVPVGMEQQVYTLSLIAIDLDTGREADYLLELAEGLASPRKSGNRSISGLVRPAFTRARH